jgi:hypothetical protein
LAFRERLDSVGRWEENGLMKETGQWLAALARNSLFGAITLVRIRDGIGLSVLDVLPFCAVSN